MYNKNIEMGFQSAVSHLCQRPLVPLLHNSTEPDATAYIYGQGKPSKALLMTRENPAEHFLWENPAEHFLWENPAEHFLCSFIQYHIQL